jgi:hypothetical protein
MPDLTGLPALDVFVGMAFLFFLLATVVSSINEVVQTVLNARARILTRGIRTLLGDKEAADEFFKQWRVDRLAKPAGFVRNAATSLKVPWVKENRRASYIPSRAFALTLLETATREEGDPKPKVGKDLFDEAERTVGKLGIPIVQNSAQAALSATERKVDAIRAELERTFDEAMDRASGWYKRYVQWWLVVFAVIVAVGLNVNSFTVAERLWKDDALRAAVLEKADKAAAENGSATTAKTAQDVANNVDRVNQLKLPIGWEDANTGGDLLGRVGGWLVTIAAIALGAPFWFDVLGKLARVRNAGNREGTAKDSSRAPEDRDDPSRVRPATG